MATNDNISYIEDFLFYEMVDNRCFCEPGSREFIEFRKASVKTERSDLLIYPSESLKIYSTDVVITFSGQSRTFHVVVKLLPIEVYTGPDFVCFGQEERIYNKALPLYGQEFFLKCYDADQIKNGRPVIVIDNPEFNSFKRISNRKFNEDETKLLVAKVAKFHGRGLKLKETKSDEYTKFCEEVQKGTYIFNPYEGSQEELEKRIYATIHDFSISDCKLTFTKLSQILGHSQYQTMYQMIVKTDEYSVINNGYLMYNNIWFKEQNDKTTDVLIFDWQYSRYGSIGIDLVSILLQTEMKLNEAFDLYVKTIQEEYSQIKENAVRQQIIIGILYVISLLTQSDPRYKEMIESLDKVCEKFLDEKTIKSST